MNQKKYLEGYAAQHSFSNIIHYTDDGWSGGNFDRPAWKRLPTSRLGKWRWCELSRQSLARLAAIR